MRLSVPISARARFFSLNNARARFSSCCLSLHRAMPIGKLRNRSLPKEVLDARGRERPRLRLVSGREIVMRVPHSPSTFTYRDFYQAARDELGTEKRLSLILLYAGRVVQHCQGVYCWEDIKCKTFEVLLHS